MSDPAVASFERACAHDRAGREEEAVPCYEDALARGLGDPERPRAFVGLGSSLRNLRRHAEAVAILEQGLTEYPDHAGMRLFHALALRSAGREREAFAALGRLVLDEADLQGYERAAAFYLGQLD